MKWKQVDGYHIRAHGYSVAKFFMGDRARYGAYYDKVCLGLFKTPDEAKAVCAKHRRSK